MATDSKASYKTIRCSDDGTYIYVIDAQHHPKYSDGGFVFALPQDNLSHLNQLKDWLETEIFLEFAKFPPNTSGLAAHKSAFVQMRLAYHASTFGLVQFDSKKKPFS